MRGLRIIDPGMHSTIQDGGRIGFREFGLPLSGAMDSRSFHLANWLVRNQRDEAVIETTLYGLEIEFMSGTSFAICGGDMLPELNNRKIENWQSYRAKAGMKLRLTGLRNGTRAYISLGGGLRIDPQLGSMSTYIKGNLGGQRGRELQKGDILPLYPHVAFLSGKRKLEAAMIPEYSLENELRVVKGVDYNLFSYDEINIFKESEYVVSGNSDRMGLRLEGQALTKIDKTEIISYGIHPGTIQIPGDGNPIIMGMDCQTVGGYPQLANIISCDLPQLGQLKPGDKIRFRFISYKEADTLYLEYHRSIDQLFGKSGTVCTDCIEKRR